RWLRWASSQPTHSRRMLRWWPRLRQPAPLLKPPWRPRRRSSSLPVTLAATLPSTRRPPTRSSAATRWRCSRHRACWTPSRRRPPSDQAQRASAAVYH
ncbi:hypothetical protein IWQ57_003782, partial [Coemansia nantahalensis]